MGDGGAGDGIGGGPARRVVAVVDDDPFIRAALGRLVRSIGYATVLFEGAEPLLSHGAVEGGVAGGGAAGGLFCVLADLQMPGVGGVELIRILGRRHPSLPVVAMTAYPGEAIRQRALEAGAVAYLAKPFDAAVLEVCLSGFSPPGDS